MREREFKEVLSQKFTDHLSSFLYDFWYEFKVGLTIFVGHEGDIALFVIKKSCYFFIIA